MNNKMTNLQPETLAYLQRMAPQYAELVNKHWQLVLEIFCKKEIERFHNFVFPASQHGIALRLTLEAVEAL